MTKMREQNEELISPHKHFWNKLLTHMSESRVYSWDCEDSLLLSLIWNTAILNKFTQRISFVRPLYNSLFETQFTSNIYLVAEDWLSC